MPTTITVLEEAKQTLARMEPEFKAALPSHISFEKFKNVANTALQNNQDLLQCNRQSLWNSIIKCAQDGLLPDGREAVLVKRKDYVAYMPMVQGILKKVRNSGELATIDAQVVYENDKYDSWTDEKGPHFTHRKAISEKGNPRLTYAYAITKDGAVYFEEISEEDMKKIESCAKTDMVWGGDFRNEMKRKSAIHRLSKRLPMSTDLENLIHRDEELYDMPKEEKDYQSTTSSKLSEAIVQPQQPIDVKAEIKEIPPVKLDVNVGAINTFKENDQPTKENTAYNTKPSIFKEILIEKISYQNSSPDAKSPWKLAGVKIGDEYYNTFDTKIHAILEEVKNKRILVNLHFKEEIKNKKSYRVITEITYPTVDQVETQWEKEDKEKGSPI